jgi:hypothetical protein
MDFDAILRLQDHETDRGSKGEERRIHMIARMTIALFVMSIGGIVAPDARADGIPLINSAVVDYTVKTLTISGTGFGASPAITLGTVPLGRQSATSTQIVATFPSQSPPSAFAPGDYFLKVTFSSTSLAIFTVTLGAVGPQGIPGQQGAPGSQGAPGANGTNGTNGANGMSVTFAGYVMPGDPNCPNGGAVYHAANGTSFVCNGKNGNDGRDGKDGVGATRADGPCFDNVNRYVDCGNGTVTDTVTGLMWLKQWDCLPNNTWAAANQAAAGLKNGDCGLADNSASGDWRLPTKAEWEATIAHAVALGCKGGESGGPPSLTDDAGTACYGNGAESSFAGLPSFGNPRLFLYWSSTAIELGPDTAWEAHLGGGFVNVNLNGKPDPLRVWPVRSATK